jgi:hypothetical protein
MRIALQTIPGPGPVMSAGVFVFLFPRNSKEILIPADFD